MYHTHQFLGYLRVTDFGIARILKPENFQDTSGTPGYMGKLFINYILAPEVMWRQNHGIGVDYFAVGVIAYEWMFGKRPYVGRSRKEIRDHILSKQIYRSNFYINSFFPQFQLKRVIFPMDGL